MEEKQKRGWGTWCNNFKYPGQEGPVNHLCSVFFFFLSFFFFVFSGAAPTAYGGSLARGLIGAAATRLRQSHSNSGSEPRLRPTPQLTATPDP